MIQLTCAYSIFFINLLLNTKRQGQVNISKPVYLISLSYFVGVYVPCMEFLGIMINVHNESNIFHLIDEFFYNIYALPLYKLKNQESY